MVQELIGWTRVLHSLGNPWVVTFICLFVILAGSRTGAFYTPSSRIASVHVSGDEWTVLRFVTMEAIKNSIFFGATTILVVRWDKWWLTAPATMVAAVIGLPTLLQDLIIIVGTIPGILTRPHFAIPIVVSTMVRIAGDAVMLVYLALTITALVT